MMQSDLKLIHKDPYLKDIGCTTLNYFEYGEVEVFGNGLTI